MQIYWTEIKQIIQETDDIKTYLLDIPEEFSWEEGAFTHVGLKGFNEGEKPNRGLVRHMSICTLPSEKTIGFTTRIRQERSEFKEFLDRHEVGDKVALFKTHCNVPLRREGKNIFLLSSGVGLATFRPLILEYLNDTRDITQLISLQVDSAETILFESIIKANPDKAFQSSVVNNRRTYYETLNAYLNDQDSLFYIVGSDEFLKDNIALLLEKGIEREQIMLDKRVDQLPEFFPLIEVK